ncbi:MAG TPA: phosphoribulokinase [Thermodesulfobacteriota bacterium]
MALERPIVLAVVGDSAAGKTTLTDGIAEILGPDRVTKVCTDDYHKYDRHERRIRNLTPLHPDANYLDVLELDLQRLCRGEPILKPVYDHRDGTLARPEYVSPKRFIIVEGLFGLYTERMRECFDVKVYLDPAEELRRLWKITRDTTKRGYTPNEVLRDLERREPDSARFIRPQRAHADLVVRFHPGASGPAAGGDGHLNVRLVLRPRIPHPNLSAILGDADDGPVRLTLGRDDGLPVDFLEIDGQVTPEETARVEQAIWRSMPADVRPLPAAIGLYADRFERRHSNPLAITQALITFHLLRAAHAVTSRTVR